MLFNSTKQLLTTKCAQIICALDFLLLVVFNHVTAVGRQQLAVQCGDMPGLSLSLHW